ncbi:MAG TPA: hypothetical protein PKC24_14645 [Cyclobacteriaceae bacterium]|nr:hypothetical protein [Cyclobacteriaceae bacterium]
MKNVLIPTTLKPDTLKAIKTAVRNANGENIKIVLLMLSEMPDGISDLLFTIKATYETTVNEQRVLDECRKYVKDYEKIYLQVHHQTGISAPLLKNIMHHHAVGLVILTPSFKAETKSIYRHTTALLNNCDCPILHLTEKVEELVLDQAIFVQNAPTRISMEEVQQMMRKEFDLRVVSQATLKEGQNPEDLSPVLVETIEKNHIDLLIETRKPEKPRVRASKNGQSNTLAEKLGVPVLTLFEN